MKVSLVVPTVGRIKELERLLWSVARQTYRDYEVIVVDQNPDERLSSLVSRFSDMFPIIRVRSDRGASRARNRGFHFASGEIVTFPDDDCWYPEDLLERVVALLDRKPGLAGAAGCVVDEKGRFSVGRWDIRGGTITKSNVWTRSAESSIFLRRSAMVALGGFDERLGPGAGTPWGAFEGDDLILRGLGKGMQFYYDPTLRIFHPNPVREFDPKAIERARRYGTALGFVMRRHRIPGWLFAYYLLRPLGGATLKLASRRVDEARYYWASFLGRLQGWLLDL